MADSERRALLARRVEESRATLEQADKEAAEIQRALERSRAVRERTLPALRRAGLLR